MNAYGPAPSSGDVRYCGCCDAPYYIDNDNNACECVFNSEIMDCVTHAEDQREIDTEGLAWKLGLDKQPNAC